jgi:hypothetical protein
MEPNTLLKNGAVRGLSVSHFAQERMGKSGEFPLIDFSFYGLAGRTGCRHRKSGRSELIRRTNTLVDAKEEEFLEEFIIAEESYPDELQEHASLHRLHSEKHAVFMTRSIDTGAEDDTDTQRTLATIQTFAGPRQ